MYFYKINKENMAHQTGWRLRAKQTSCLPNVFLTRNTRKERKNTKKIFRLFRLFRVFRV